MRDIKFRAWDGIKLHFECFVWGSMQSNNLPLRTFSNIFHDKWMFGDGGEILLEQYTGQKDKNDVEIYEGDICLFENYHTGVKYIKGKKTPLHKWNMIGVVEWYEDINSCPMFKFNIVNGNYFDNWCYSKEVIGNIHENPELLESK